VYTTQTPTPPPSDFRCRREDGNCWQFGYKGHLCIHALVAAVDMLSRTADSNAKIKIGDAACNACHKNWQRSTYMLAGVACTRIECTRIADTPPIRPSQTQCARDGQYAGEQRSTAIDNRFQRAKATLPTAALLAVLKILEMRAIYRNDFTVDLITPSLQVTVYALPAPRPALRPAPRPAPRPATPPAPRPAPRPAPTPATPPAPTPAPRPSQTGTQYNKHDGVHVLSVYAGTLPDRQRTPG